MIRTDWTQREIYIYGTARPVYYFIHFKALSLSMRPPKMSPALHGTTTPLDSLCSLPRLMTVRSVFGPPSVLRIRDHRPERKVRLQAQRDLGASPTSCSFFIFAFICLYCFSWFCLYLDRRYSALGNAYRVPWNLGCRLRGWRLICS